MKHFSDYEPLSSEACKFRRNYQRELRARQNISIKRLESGYWHIRGNGPCNWTQPPFWPCTSIEIRECAFPEASEEFLKLVENIASEMVQP